MNILGTSSTGNLTTDTITGNIDAPAVEVETLIVEDVNDNVLYSLPKTAPNTGEYICYNGVNVIWDTVTAGGAGDLKSDGTVEMTADLVTTGIQRKSSNPDIIVQASPGSFLQMFGTGSVNLQAETGDTVTLKSLSGSEIQIQDDDLVFTAGDLVANDKIQFNGKTKFNGNVVYGSGSTTYNNSVNYPLIGADKVLTTNAFNFLTGVDQKTGFNLDVGTTAGTLASGDHTHTEYIESASNVGTGGVDVFKQEVANDLQFRQIRSNNANNLTVVLDGDNIDIDVVNGLQANRFPKTQSQIFNGQTVEVGSTGLISAVKQSAYNKAYGTTAGTTLQGSTLNDAITTTTNLWSASKIDAIAGHPRACVHFSVTPTSLNAPAGCPYFHSAGLTEYILGKPGEQTGGVALTYVAGVEVDVDHNVQSIDTTPTSGAGDFLVTYSVEGYITGFLGGVTAFSFYLTIDGVKVESTRQSFTEFQQTAFTASASSVVAVGLLNKIELRMEHGTATNMNVYGAGFSVVKF